VGNVSINRVESIQGHFRAITRVMPNPIELHGIRCHRNVIREHGQNPREMEGLAWGTAPAFAKDFRNTHARHLTTTISSAATPN
jgi:hypothetical protein